jgi:hypothetical protein
VADIVFGTPKKRGRTGHSGANCGLCGRSSAITPCARCVAFIAGPIAHGEVRERRVRLARKTLQPPKVYATCGGCGRVLSYAWSKPLCSKCYRNRAR